MSRITSREVLTYGSQVFDIPASDITGRSRRRHIALARMSIVYCIRQLCPHMSSPRIGALMGGRDHTTILDAVKRAPVLAEGDPDMADGIRQIMEHFRQPCAQVGEGGGDIISTPPLTQTAEEALKSASGTGLPATANR